MNSKLSFSDLIAVALTLGIPVAVWGDTGIGKTTSIYEECNSRGTYFESFVASIREPSEASGIPFVHEGQVRYSVPVMFKNFIEGAEHTWKLKDGSTANSAVMFIDEITTCHLDMQNALLKVVDERMAGEF